MCVKLKTEVLNLVNMYIATLFWELQYFHAYDALIYL